MGVLVWMRMHLSAHLGVYVTYMHARNCVNGVSLLAGVLVVVYQHSIPLW